MTGADRTVRLLGLAVARPRRARYVEEWRADLAAARSLGMAPAAILLAVCRVALLLLRLRIRDRLVRLRGGTGLVGVGVLLGLVLVVADAPPEDLVPFAVLVLVARGRRPATARIDGGR